MRTVAVIGRKGGSGKTTLAVHLAIGFHRRGRATVLADADPQRSSIEVLKARRAPGPEAIATAGPKLFALKTTVMRGGAQALVIDTAAVLEEEVAHAVVLADLVLLVVRPTFLDLAAAAQTADIIRRLRRPGLVVLNQAPVARESVEPPMVKRSIEAQRLLRLPVAPVVVRSRAAYQTVLESGASVEEVGSDPVAAQEMAAFCAFVDRFAFGERRAEPALAAPYPLAG
jgi:chromosome partitioning protein